MIPSTNDDRLFRFSTVALPRGERARAIYQLYERVPFPGKIEPLEALPDRLPNVDLTKRALPGLEFITGVFSGVCQRARPEGQSHTGQDELFLWLNVRGTSTVYRGAEELTTGDGSAFVASRGRSGFAIYSPGRVRFLGMRMPRAALVPLVRDLDSGRLRAMHGDTAALKLLTTYVAGIASDATSLSAETARAFVTHIYDLVALAIGPTRDGAMIAEDRGIRAARLHQIKCDILANLGDCDLNAATVAARHGITPRYVHKLFECQGVTFAEFVRSQRLAFAYRMLTDARFAERFISSIAYEVGFGDLSNFNHYFRRRYGATPSEIRRSYNATGIPITNDGT